MVLEAVVFLGILATIFFIIIGFFMTFKRNVLLAMMFMIFLFPVFLVWCFVEGLELFLSLSITSYDKIVNTIKKGVQ